MPMELGYWNIRGLAGGIRMLLEYCGADWIDTQYEVVQAASSSDMTIKVGDRATAWDASQWFNAKNSPEFQENFDFPNLPWLKDGDVHISQSNTVFQYIARKYKIGQDLSDTEAWRIDLAKDQLGDFRLGFLMMLYDMPSHPWAERETYCKNTLIPNLEQIDRFIGANTYVAGATLTWVDFMFWETFDQMHRFDDSLFSGLENIMRFKTHFESLPKVKAFFDSDKFMVGPIVNKMALWGGDRELKKSW